MDTLKYKQAPVAQAAGVKLHLLKQWERAERQLIRREEGRLYTFRRALQVAIMARLVALGVRPETASRASFDFTDAGSGPLPGKPARDPGQMFSSGWTLLCLYPGDIIDVKNLQPDGAAAELFVPMGYNRADAVVALNVTFLAQRLRDELEGADAQG